MEEKILGVLNQLLDGQKRLETRFDGLETRFDGLETRFDGLETRFDGLETRFDGLENQVKENTQILKALEHAAQVSKAEINKMSFDISEIKGDVCAIRKDLAAVELVTAKNWSDITTLKSIK